MQPQTPDLIGYVEVDLRWPPIPTHRVKICTPSGPVDQTFTASGRLVYPTTHVTECFLLDADGNRYDATAIRNPPDVAPGTWEADFSDIPAGDYVMIAKGNTGCSDTSPLIVEVGGPGGFVCVTGEFPKDSDNECMLKPEAIGVSRRKTDAAGISVSFASDSNVAFNVGGTVKPPTKDLKCLLDDRQPEALNREGQRWSAKFRNVPPGTYTLRVTAGDATDMVRIQVGALQGAGG